MRKNDSREVCKNLNVVRDNNCNCDLSKKEVLELLKGIVPGLPTYFTIAVKFGLINKEKYGTYSLPSEPIYIGRVESYLKEYRKAAAKSNSKKKAKPKETVVGDNQPENNQPEIMNENDLVESAIAILKQTGDYRILKKVVTITWEEV